MAEARLDVRMPSRRTRHEFQRACQLLGITMTKRLHQTVYATIRRARDKFPQEFMVLHGNDDDRVFEAVEEHCKTIFDIQIYTRFDKMRIADALQRLIAAGYVRERREPGSGHRLYVPTR